jgi:hypothetical protein
MLVVFTYYLRSFFSLFLLRCGGWSRLISNNSLVQVPGQLNCWALFRDCVGVSCMYELFKLDMLLPCKSLLQIWSIKWEVFGETLSLWTPTRTTTNWPLIILGLPSLFLEMSICQLVYYGIFILICPNMLCAKSVDSACVRMLCKMRQQRGLKVVLAYVTNVLVKMNMFRTRCMHFCFAKTIKFVSCSWGNTFPSCLHLFLRTS